MFYRGKAGFSLPSQGGKGETGALFPPQFRLALANFVRFCLNLAAAPATHHRADEAAMQTTSDEVLIARIAGGDRLAMQVLFARHQVRVYRFVLRLVRNEATAEDLISEVFLDVWRQAGKFEGRSAVSTWMLNSQCHEKRPHSLVM